ncbi:MAG: 16S rRNA (guanine(527)-N(7))-methyltransferase RsmG [Ruminococcus sp.]|nr:16S rRNA (guanine(527)-N(7))-methyltransferase RsmG [Ruminococcus sp.]
MLPDFELSCSIFEQNGLKLNREIYNKLDVYAEFLINYNKKVNLTAITEPNEILIKHFIDSIILYKFVDLPQNSRIIDVGTGAGFPSVPLKIYRPDLKITLLDSLNKRINFLMQLCDLISVDAEFVHGRAEDVAKMPEFREKFDFACARAVANMSLLSELCISFVKVGGTFIAMKGPNEDVSLGSRAVEILGGDAISTQNYFVGDEERRIITVKKILQTLPKYPRNSSQLKKKLL